MSEAPAIVCPAIVLDTNVLISALISPMGTTADAAAIACSRNTVIHSIETMDELTEKLSSRRLAKFLGPETAAAWLQAMREYSTLVETAPQTGNCRDAKDNKFLDLAVSGNAVAIISGDADLQVLGSVKGAKGLIPILSPAQYVAAQPPLNPAENPGPLATLLLARRG